LCGCTWVKEPCASAKADVQGKRALYMYRAKEPCTSTKAFVSCVDIPVCESVREEEAFVSCITHLQRPLYIYTR